MKVKSVQSEVTLKHVLATDGLKNQYHPTVWYDYKRKGHVISLACLCHRWMKR